MHHHITCEWIFITLIQFAETNLVHNFGSFRELGCNDCDEYECLFISLLASQEPRCQTSHFIILNFIHLNRATSTFVHTDYGSVLFTMRCYATAVYAFVCLSVTLRYCIKMAKHRITQITPHDSPGTHFLMRNSNITPMRAKNASGVG